MTNELDYTLYPALLRTQNQAILIYFLEADK